MCGGVALEGCENEVENDIGEWQALLASLLHFGGRGGIYLLVGDNRSWSLHNGALEE
jgi:hypothetical protein